MSWVVRKDVLREARYSLNPEVFSIELHHGGTFRWGKEISYVGGKIHYIDNCKPAEMSYLDLIAMAAFVDCHGVKRLFFKKCRAEFSDLLEIKFDEEAIGLSKHLTAYRVVEVYCDNQGEYDSNENANTSSEDEDYTYESCDDDLESFDGSDEELGREDDGLDEELNDLIAGNDVVEYAKRSTSKGKDSTKGKGKEKAKGKGTNCELISTQQNDEDMDILNEGYASDCELFNSDCDSDEEREVDNNIVFQKVDLKKVKFTLGMQFNTTAEFKLAVKKYAVQQGKNIKYKRNSEQRMNLYCKAENNVDCPWSMYVSHVGKEHTVQIKTFIDVHTCNRAYKNSSAKPRFIAHQYLERIRRNPRWDVMAFRDEVAEELECEVTYSTAHRAFHYAKKILNGTSGEQYKLLWDYIAEIKRSNPGTTAIMKVLPNEGEKGESRFSRLYICWGALKRGFIEGCRPLFGVDGCHLTGPHRGVLLTAVAIDPNNCMYPFSYAVVDHENYSTWKWFLKLLRSDLNIQNFGDYTVISDKQKGLIKAMQKVFPGVEHRFCVRHLYNNFKKEHMGLALKEILWKAARAPIKPYFTTTLEEMRDLDSAAYEWLFEKPAEKWSRSHFGTHSKCDILLNNLCESYNAAIKLARGQPILSMLEAIRLHLMDLTQKKRATMLKKIELVICPKINTKLEDIRKNSHQWILRSNGNRMFEVSGPYTQRYAVDVNKRECGCRKWQLTGIPCQHAIAGIHHLGEDPISFVHECYSRETYLRTYNNLLKPLNGKDLWVKTGGVDLLPPKVKVQVGKPQKARIRDKNEPPLVRKRKAEPVQENNNLVDESNEESSDEGENRGHNDNSGVRNEESSRARNEESSRARNEESSGVINEESWARNEESSGVRNEEISGVRNESQSDTWLNAMRGDGLGLPQSNWNNNKVGGSTSQDSGSMNQVRQTSEHMEVRRSSFQNEASGKTAYVSPKRTKTTARKSITPVRRSSRIMDNVRSQAVPTVSFMDLTNEEELTTHESVNMGRHGGTFNNVACDTNDDNEVPQSSTMHAGIIKKGEDLPTGQFQKKGVRYISLNAMKVALEAQLKKKKK